MRTDSLKHWNLSCTRSRTSFILPFGQRVDWLIKRNDYIVCFLNLKRHLLTEIPHQGSDSWYNPAPLRGSAHPGVESVCPWKPTTGSCLFKRHPDWNVYDFSSRDDKQCHNQTPLTRFWIWEEHTEAPISISLSSLPLFLLAFEFPFLAQAYFYQTLSSVCLLKQGHPPYSWSFHGQSAQGQREEAPLPRAAFQQKRSCLAYSSGGARSRGLIECRPSCWQSPEVALSVTWKDREHVHVCTSLVVFLPLLIKPSRLKNRESGFNNGGVNPNYVMNPPPRTSKLKSGSFHPLNTSQWRLNSTHEALGTRIYTQNTA